MIPEGARKSAEFIAIANEPDWCWTPRGGKKKLVAYVIACDLADSAACSPNTFFTQDPVFLFKTSYAPRVKGNEHGVGDGPGTSGIDERGNGGLKTEIHNGVVWVDEKAVDVFVNGIQVVRHLDHCFMNVKPPT